MKYDFGGYATKNDIRCSDGRTIRGNAFRDNDGAKVPLVWQHLRDDPENVIGHALLENREDGVYAYCALNGTKRAQTVKALVEHGDLDSMSIYANKLRQSNTGDVLHGDIKEVSVVISPANPGARIDNLAIEHADGTVVDLNDEAVIYGDTLDEFDLDIEHADDEDDEDGDEGEEPDSSSEGKQKRTVRDVFNTMNDEQKKAVYAMVGFASQMAKSGESDEGGDSAEHSAEGGFNNAMKKNVFEGSDVGSNKYTLTHADFDEIFANAKKCNSFRDALHEKIDELQHGIDNLEILFPEAKNLTPNPEIIARPMEWVSKVWNACSKSPFARIKSTAADLTADEARAKGYIKGHRKVEEQFSLLKRVTYPQTVYKKQKLDRDDIIDITDFDIVAFMRREMRMMLDEELARAVLIGDGRMAGEEDKINESNIRPIYTDDDLYAIHYTVEIPAETDESDRAHILVSAALKSRKEYRGSGSPVFYTDTDTITDMLLARDKIGNYLYRSQAELAQALRVREIVEVPVMENQVRNTEGGPLKLIGIIVNLTDYTIGADRGGQITNFDDFDIDYNQYKYLIETRCSGALRRPYSAIVLEAKPGEAIKLPPTIKVTAMKPTETVQSAGTTTAGAIQSAVQVGSDFITGKLKYQEKLTDFSSNAEINNGYFLALTVDSSADDNAFTVEIIGGKDKPKKATNDHKLLLRITDPATQKLKLSAEKDGLTTVRVFNFRSLFLD